MRPRRAPPASARCASCARALLPAGRRAPSLRQGARSEPGIRAGVAGLERRRHGGRSWPREPGIGAARCAACTALAGGQPPAVSGTRAGRVRAVRGLSLLTGHVPGPGEVNFLEPASRAESERHQPPVVDVAAGQAELLELRGHSGRARGRALAALPPAACCAPQRPAIPSWEGRARGTEACSAHRSGRHSRREGC